MLQNVILYVLRSIAIDTTSYQIILKYVEKALVEITQ